MSSLPDPPPSSNPENQKSDPVPIPKCVLCAWCGRAGEAGSKPGWCAICAPDPATRAWLAAQVRQRVRQAIRTARAVIPAPNREHVWLPHGTRSVAHLFGNGSTTSYCGKVDVAAPARSWVDKPASVALRACSRCEEVYRSRAQGSA